MLDFIYNPLGDTLARIPYQVTVKGRQYGASVISQKDRHGSETFVAIVKDEKGAVISTGYGDTPFEACDDARMV